LEKIKIFSGKSCPELAEKICQQLGTSLSPLKIKEYANGCFEVIIKDDVRNKIVFLIQTSVPNPRYLHENLWELFQMTSAAFESGAKEIIVVIPYVSYARSDKIYTPGMTISGELLVKLLEASGMTRFIGIDFHSKEFEEFFSKKTKVYHLSALPLIVRYLKTKNLENVTLLPGDKGAQKRTSLLAEKLDVPVGSVEKTRISDTKAKIEKISGNITGRDIVLFDDEISPVATTVRTLAKELDKYGAKDLTVAVTHASITQETVRRLRKIKILKEIIITDTVPIPEKIRKSLPLTVLSVTELLVTTIKTISEEDL